MRNISFQREPLSAALIGEALPLLRAHWREIAHYPDIPLDVDVAAYEQAEANGAIRCYTARIDLPRQALLGTVDLSRGRLVGYAVYVVRNNLHYRSSIQAAQDVLYLHPSVRGGTGYKFIAWCDRQLALDGVQVVFQHVKQAHDFGPLLERQGYEVMDLIFAKRLDLPSPGRATEARQPHKLEVAGSTPAPATPWSAVDETNDLARTRHRDMSVVE